jgi:hypothetical protein
MCSIASSQGITPTGKILSEANVERRPWRRMSIRARPSGIRMTYILPLLPRSTGFQLGNYTELTIHFHRTPDRTGVNINR